MSFGFLNQLARISILLALVATDLPVTHAQSGIGDSYSLSPYWNWQTIETANFRLSFDAKNALIAERFAAHLEEAHRILQPLFQWTPRQKTQVLVVDNSDLANGLTGASLRFGLLLYVTPPETYNSTYYYDDWLKLLTFHEYTHFLNMDPTTGWMEALRTILGDQVRPNSLWSTWMLEGFAVYIETRHTTAGRGRSPYYDMILRSAVDERTLDTDAFITLDRANGEYPYPPSGEIPYLFGYKLVEKLARENGDRLLGDLSIASSHRMPYFVNGNLENHTGQDFYSTWNRWIVDTQVRLQAQLAQITQEKITETESLSTPAIDHFGHAISPDGQWIAYTRQTVDKRFSLYLQNLKTGQVRHVEDKYFGAGSGFTPDSRFLIYSGVTRSGQFNFFSDLFAYDVQKKKIHRLSTQWRAKDPAVAPDGKSIVFAQAQESEGSVVLVRAPLGMNAQGIPLLGEPTVLTPLSFFDRVALPKFSPDSKRVIYSLHTNGKSSEEIYEWDLQAEQVTQLVSNGAYNRFPFYGPDGKIYFVSDLSGIDNLYQLTSGPQKTIRRLSNFKTGLWFPTVDTQGTFYGAVFKNRGWVLSRLKLEPLKNPSELKIKVGEAPASLSETNPRSESPDPPQTRLKPYSAWPTLAPRAWSPFLGSHGGSLFYGAAVYGNDAADLHEYYLLGDYDSLYQNFEADLAYANRTLGPTIQIEQQIKNNYLSVFGDNSTALTRLYRTTLSASFPFRWTWETLVPRLSTNWDYSTTGTTSTGLTAAPTLDPNAEFRLFYTNIETSKLGISGEQGVAFDSGVRQYFTRGSATRAFVSASTYIRLAPHFIAVPRFSLLWSNQPFVSVAGRSLRVLENIGAAYANNLDGLFLRGYPATSFYSRFAEIMSLELRYPIFRIFRGLGTNPLFFEQIYGFSFFDAGYFPNNDVWAPSVGSGLRVSLDALLRVPLSLSLEYHQGLNANLYGNGQCFFTVYYGGQTF